ncbi:MAG: HAMP domain-containing histidine kinase [Nitrospirae bacterium]|nr:HAMP domain-containing histidine kinase [Nitrospirota bacterium]
MRNKLFLAFLAVIFLVIVSHLIDEQLISRDFDDYVNGTREDKLYWVLASIEGSYADGKWDNMPLHEALHWAIMLGFDVRVLDINKREVINSAMVMGMLSPSMKRRMTSITDLSSATGEFEPYPLYEGGKEIGTLLARKLSRPGVDKKEADFRQRGKYFLVVSSVIAGGGALLLALFFTLFFSRPLKKMKEAGEAMANGDLSVRVSTAERDEIGRLAESFNYMAEALQKEDALRRRLTSNIAHELRTPLAVMKANAEAMIDGVVADHAQGLENIRLEIEKLIRLVEGIEDITKAEASFFSKKDHAEIDLSEFLARMASTMLPLAAEKGLHMTAPPERSIRVITDPEKLERILQNILSNAIKYTEKGEISIDCGQKKKRFFIEVRDSGIGIPEDKKELIFRRFYRGDRSHGIGLGLAIVKELLDVMGGSIEVDSSEGKGTTFRIWLPENP